MNQRDVAPAVDEATLKQAEAFIEQEEGAANRLVGPLRLAIMTIAAAMTLYHLYAGFFGEPAYVLRRVHLGFVLVLVFLLFPVAARAPCPFVQLPSLMPRSPRNLIAPGWNGTGEFAAFWFSSDRLLASAWTVAHSAVCSKITLAIW